MSVLFSLKISEKDRERLKANYPTLKFTFCDNMDEAQKHIDEAEVIVTYGSDLTDTLVEYAKKLKWVNVLSAGLDQLPFDALEKKSVIVTTVRGIHKIPMAEYDISMLRQVYRLEKTRLDRGKEHVW